MKTVTLRVDDSIDEQFFWLLGHFSQSEVKVLEQSEYMSDDEYLRSIEGMVQSIRDARNEPVEQCVALDRLEW
uniref:Uncharacterized protein n=1 Tax=Candidatus Kentrum sp. LPFa TaxID=2126335 RepID=A0A450VUI0_9GAMM|nr:MAG: hypothetical protein BECKLPF1236A_GA0070988_1001719 [Candidatus Kentron sp. LPFa]VFK24684.1 MAG: hypothetical protein BECKLPF1236C_GA0070990_1001520 [Candidatus Kentron sp. LPFa]